MKKMSVFENFRLLKADMIEKGWIIEAFPFSYKKCDYIVLAKLYKDGEKKPKYALMKVEVLKGDNFDDSLISDVNANGFLIEAKQLRIFFNIEYGKNLGYLLSQFNEYFSRFIPAQVILNKTPQIKEAMNISLSKSDGQNPNKRYCFAVKRNPEGEKRSLFNDNKTKLLRPVLYAKFSNDQSISFCYSTNISDEKTDKVIISNFANRQSLRC